MIRYIFYKEKKRCFPWYRCERASANRTIAFRCIFFFIDCNYALSRHWTIRFSFSSTILNNEPRFPPEAFIITDIFISAPLYCFPSRRSSATINANDAHFFRVEKAKWAIKLAISRYWRAASPANLIEKRQNIRFYYIYLIYLFNITIQ